MSFGCTPKSCGACGVVRCRKCVAKCYDCKAWHCRSEACADCGLHDGSKPKAEESTLPSSPTTSEDEEEE